MGAPTGNKNAIKNRPFAEAIRRVLLENDGAQMRALAQKIVQMASNGEIAALREVFDRIDGKVTQEISGPDGGPLEVAQVSREEVARRYAFLMSRAAIAKASKTSKEPV